MSIEVRNTVFDVAIMAGPRIQHWPSIGVRALSKVCVDAGLRVGVFGGPTLKTQGVLPLPVTGGVAIVQDSQGRVHRIEARSIVRVEAWLKFPDPFPGWASEGCLPLDVAERLLESNAVVWTPAIAVLGSGNKAFRFLRRILETKKAQEAWCIESNPSDWEGKRYSGWEVERRRFESLGGKLLEGIPISLSRKSALIWEFRLQDPKGVRILPVARLVSAGPFDSLLGAGEYPSGSLLFQMEQTAELEESKDVEGWKLEEERGRWIGARISRALAENLGRSKKDQLDRSYRASRQQLKFFERHREEPNALDFEGKWIDRATRARFFEHPGTPRGKEKRALVASIECVEPIACDLCAQACPEGAIAPTPGLRALTESKCTACGICLDVCPSSVPVLVHEPEGKPYAKLTLSERSAVEWKAGDTANLMNRRGQPLGSARVSKFENSRVELEVPPHLLWEARALKKKITESLESSFQIQFSTPDEMKGFVEISLDGEKRLAREGVAVTEHFFQTGRARPGETLSCTDGSCGLCEIEIDGIRRLACRETVRRGMSITRIPPRFEAGPEIAQDALCPCLGIPESEVVERVSKGNLSSPEAVRVVTKIGEGRCNGLLCRDAFRRLLVSHGVEAKDWVDWRFPWTEWSVRRERP